MVTQERETGKLTGYSAADTYLATRYWQGEREVFCIDLGLDRVTNLVREPDPAHPTAANRRISLTHAQDFAKYLRGQTRAVIPALLLRAPSQVFEFETWEEMGGTSWGVLSVPKLARDDVAIIDGQHRTLGMHIAAREIAEELATARHHRAVAKKDQDSALFNHWENQVRQLEEQRNRFSLERVSLHIVIVDDEREYQQIFVDIADNAKGISQSVRARLDSSKIVNRTLPSIVEHVLVVGRLDNEADRILGENPNLLGLKHVADISRILQVGISGRISTRKEDELEEGKVIGDTLRFLDAMKDGFADLQQVASGKLAPPQLRRTSLLGSATMIRLLADTYRRIGDHLHAVAFFESLSKHMAAPVSGGSPWLESSAMKEGAMAPTTASMGDQKRLSDTIMKWYEAFAQSQNGAVS